MIHYTDNNNIDTDNNDHDHGNNDDDDDDNKDRLERVPEKDFLHARNRANPYEFVGKHFFMNRFVVTLLLQITK